MIPFLNFKDLNIACKEEFMDAILSVVDSGHYILGEKVREFEDKFSKYCGVEETIGTGNCLDALILITRAYKEMGVFHEGDEILVPANTYIASILAVTENRLVPILIEPDINTYNIDVSLLEKYITNIENASKLIDSETCELYIKDKQINIKKYLNEFDPKCLEMKNLNSP